MQQGPSQRVAVDLGNSLMKWGKVDANGQVVDRAVLPLDDPESWDRTAEGWNLPASSRWAICSVNPPREASLEDWLADRRSPDPVWFRTAISVFPQVRWTLPRNAGVDRAMMVRAALERLDDASATLIIACGTAITVDRIAPNRQWEGGVIAAGLGLTTRALRQQTALLPMIDRITSPTEPWGDATEPAMAAGIFWGTVGAIREILNRQKLASGAAFLQRVWTGGDASLIAPQIEGPNPIIIPDLVLRGVAISAFSKAGSPGNP